MSIFVVGINDKKAPVGLREQLAFAESELAPALASLSALSGVNEVVLLSTCNRTEVYCYAEQDVPLVDWFAAYKHVAVDSLHACVYRFQGLDAVKHLFRVACGLDSMVLGEPQILGQVKAGFADACLQGTVGPMLSQWFRQAFSVAKKVRASTSIGACPVSVASNAVALMVKKTPELDWSQARVLLVGAGDTIKLVLQYVAAYRPQNIAIASRHQESAGKLCLAHAATAYDLSALGRLIAEADVVFTATASPDPVITASMVQQRKGPLSIVDIAVPRDVDEGVALIDGVSLYNIDDLKEAIRSSVNVREHAATQAEQMIAEKAKMFMLSLRSREATPVIKRFRSHIERLCDAELLKAMQSCDEGNAPKEVLAAMSRAVANKVMHTPCMRMKQASSEGRSDVLNVAHELFGMVEE